MNVDHYEKLTGFVGDWRDTWWDDDFLQMMAKKWRVENVRSVLDVGCGVGHWGQRLMPLLHAEATLLGVDAEPAWMDKAAHRATSRGLGGRARYEVGDGCALPYEDNLFDMVTCQTLLMHVPDPQAVVREMARVLRPGGLFVAAEPNNFATSAGQLMAGPRRSWEQIAVLLEMEYTFALGWPDVHAHQNNQCTPKIPPYRDPHTQMDIDLLRQNHRDGVWMHVGETLENVERFCRTGGGDKDRFASLLAQVRTWDDEMIEGLEDHAYTSSGGHIHYLVWGHKPLTCP